MDFISKNSIKIFLGLLFSVILFHICIIIKLIPYNIAWGGRLSNDNEMYVFETISILINLFLAWILSMKGNLVKFKFTDKTINTILWIFFGIFVLNTVGNILAKTNFEKFFTVLTGLSAILIWNIVKQTKTTNR
jgi:membrane protease YdiL (CAAX protease family)